MKTFKIVRAVVVLGLGAFFYTNPYMLKPLLTQASQLQALLGKYFDKAQDKTRNIEVVELNTYIIDPQISNKDDYYVDSRVKSMYVEISDTMIKRDKVIQINGMLNSKFLSYPFLALFMGQA
ncbi:MAG: hypothetical protein COA44_13185 [Arcobacter sp.]|nr:MAG: hypothetical protein COA44_13185 [Arcobacter sp.]